MSRVDPQPSEAEILKWFDQIREKVVEHLRNGDRIEFIAEAGLRLYSGPGDMYIRTEYNGTRTYTIEVNGGARDTEAPAASVTPLSE